MKLLATTATTVALAAILATASFAADSTSTRPARPEGGKGKGKGAKPDIAVVVAHLTEEYSKVSSFDLDLNGQLDDSEEAAVAAAITAGTLTFTPPDGRTPPADFTPPAEHIAERVAGLYAAVAPYDSNVDGTLSADEQAALKTAIESGKLPLPGKGPKGPGRGHGKGGPADETES